MKVNHLWLVIALAVPVLASPARAEAPRKTIYGPLTFNVAGGGDFYISQGGKFVAARLVEGTIEFHLKPAAFDVGYNGRQANICLATRRIEEIQTDPSGYQLSCLADVMTGARDPHSDELLVYGGASSTDIGNTNLSDDTSLRTKPMSGYATAYRFDKLFFVPPERGSLKAFRGTLYGYVVVYRQAERRNQDIMPVRLVIE